MRISGQRGGVDDIEVVELHWMKESDAAMNASSGVAAPTLCGRWVNPDPPLMSGVEDGEAPIRYVSCVECDLLADLRLGVMSA